MKVFWLNLVSTFNVLFSRRPEGSSLKLIKTNLWRLYLLGIAVTFLSWLGILFISAVTIFFSHKLGYDIGTDVIVTSTAYLIIPVTFPAAIAILLFHVNYKLAKNKLIENCQKDKIDSNEKRVLFRDRLLRFIEVSPLLSFYIWIALVGLLSIHAAIASLIPSDSWKYLLVIFSTALHAELAVFVLIVTCVLFITIVPFRLLIHRWLLYSSGKGSSSCYGPNWEKEK